MYLDTDGISNPLIYRTFNTPKTTPVMMIQHPRRYKGSITRIPPKDYTAVSCSANNNQYCHVFLIRSHHATRCPLMSDPTRNSSIKQSFLNLTNLSMRKQYSLTDRSPKRSRRYIPYSFFSESRRLKGNSRTNPNRYHPGSRSPNTRRTRNRSPWNSGENRPQTQTSVPVAQVTALSLQPSYI